VEFGTSRDIDTVIVDGRTLIEGGRCVRVDEAQVLERARGATERYWHRVPSWYWSGADVDRIVPPAFPMHRDSRGLAARARAVCRSECPGLARALAVPEERSSRRRFHWTVVLAQPLPF